MANRIAFQMSDSCSSGEASDAGSTASNWVRNDQVSSAPPVLSSASSTPASRLTLPPSSSTNTIVRTAPVVRPASPRPGMPNVAMTVSAEPAQPPALVLNAGVLTINEFPDDSTQIPNLLLADPGIHSIVITRQTIGAMYEDKLFGQLVSIPTLSTIKLDLLHFRNESFRPCVIDMDVESRLAWLFANSPSLTKLDLSGQGIRGGFLFELADKLDKSRTSKVFDFNAGTFYPTHSEKAHNGDMAPGIASIIAKLDSVSTIQASSRFIADDGAMQIAAALKKNTGLTTLVLADNPIGQKGCAAIFDAIRKNRKTALLRLDLSGCPVGIKAAKSLAGLLKKNTSLVEVAIGAVPDVEGLKQIHDGLLKNTRVIKLSIEPIDSPNKKYFQIRSEIDAELQKRASAAEGRHAAIANTRNTASSATTNQADTVPDKRHG
jgi:hypothetical protein